MRPIILFQNIRQTMRHSSMACLQKDWIFKRVIINRKNQQGAGTMFVKQVENVQGFVG